MTKNKFGRPKKRNLNQQEVAKFLHSIHFKVDRIEQLWRHLLAFGEYQHTPAVFKLASTQETAKRTVNEFYWNDAVNHLHPPDFVVPLNLSSGHYGKLFYFIAQQFTGQPLVLPQSSDVSRIETKISQIARISRSIELLVFPEKSTLSQYQQTKNTLPIGHKLLASASEWASQVPRDLTDFIKVIVQAKDDLRTGPAHGDFVGRQMYLVNHTIGLIDGEHAGIRGPLHYDVAQFYIRLRHDHLAPGLATDYLRYFKKLLSLPDQKIFWDELKPVLTQRYLGDLWGAAASPSKLEFLKPLGQEILTNSVI